MVAILCLLWCFLINSTNCVLTSKSINERKIQVVEYTALEVNCKSPSELRGRGPLVWRIKPWRDQLKLVCKQDGSNSYNFSCLRVAKGTPHSEVDITWNTTDYSSKLRINRVERSMFNSSTISCSIPIPVNSFLNIFDNDSCNVEVIYPCTTPSPNGSHFTLEGVGVGVGAGAMLGLVLIVVMFVVCCRQLRSRCVTVGDPRASVYDGRAQQNQGTELNFTDLRSHQNGRTATYENTCTREKQPSVIYTNMTSEDGRQQPEILLPTRGPKKISIGDSIHLVNF